MSSTGDAPACDTVSVALTSALICTVGRVRVLVRALPVPVTVPLMVSHTECDAGVVGGTRTRSVADAITHSAGIPLRMARMFVTPVVTVPYELANLS